MEYTELEKKYKRKIKRSGRSRQTGNKFLELYKRKLEKDNYQREIV